MSSTIPFPTQPDSDGSSRKLTVLIPCKNEHDNIVDCIESARLVADEILVADSGSTDDTMHLVQQMPDCRLIEREFINYASFKNWAIPQASHPWILILDADERITPTLAAEIRQAIDEAPEGVDAYWVPRRTFFMGYELRYSGWDTDALLRLIRRDRCRYRACRVHEEIEFDRQRTRRLREKLLHYTYWSYDQYFEKYMKYVKWGAQDLWDRGKRPSAWGLLVRPFLRFFQLYVIRRGFLDGLVGIQSCMLQSFFVSFGKQGRLWEMKYAQWTNEVEEDDSQLILRYGVTPRRRPSIYPAEDVTRDYRAVPLNELRRKAA